MSATDNECHIKNEQQISVFSMFDLQNLSQREVGLTELPLI